MARRRVFRIKAECSLSMNISATAAKARLLKRAVHLKRLSDSEVVINFEGANVGRLDAVIAKQVAAAIERGQTFNAVIENAYQSYDENLKPTTARLDLRVKYLLKKGDPAVEVPKPRIIEQPLGPRSFHTKIAGVTFEGRQTIIPHCSVGEMLLLERQPNHPDDQGAIKVMRLNGQQLGYIPMHVSRGWDSSGMAVRMDRGVRYLCRISKITGGGDLNLGVNIEITDNGRFDTPLPLVTSTDTNEFRRLNGFILVAFLTLIIVAIFLLLRS